MADHHDSRGRYSHTRHPSASKSPIALMDRIVERSPPLHPQPSSRMSLSALVNDSPSPPRRITPPLAAYAERHPHPSAYYPSSTTDPGYVGAVDDRQYSYPPPRTSYVQPSTHPSPTASDYRYRSPVLPQHPPIHHSPTSYSASPYALPNQPKEDPTIAYARMREEMRAAEEARREAEALEYRRKRDMEFAARRPGSELMDDRLRIPHSSFSPSQMYGPSADQPRVIPGRNGKDYISEPPSPSELYPMGEDTERLPIDRYRRDIDVPPLPRQLPPPIPSEVGHMADRARSPTVPIAPPPLKIMRKRTKVVRPNDFLVGNEDVWEDGLVRYQSKREDEVRAIAQWADSRQARNGLEEASLPQTQDESMEGRKGNGDTATPINKKKRKSRKLNLDDELLGLASSPPGSPSTAAGPSKSESKHHIYGMNGPIDPANPPSPSTIVYPSGLTRAEVIAKCEAGDVQGLTEDDVKAVQDEMWMREKAAQAAENGGVLPMNKDGTVRRKPGPAKGWRKIRGIDKKKETTPGKAQSTTADSVAGSVADEEAEADIAALLDDPVTKKGKKIKRRKLEEPGAESPRFADVEDERNEYRPSNSVLPDEIEDEHSRAGSVGGSSVQDTLPSASAAPKKKNSKTKEPGVGKGRWTRPTKPEKELVKKAEALASRTSKASLVGPSDDTFGAGPGPAEEVQEEVKHEYAPNTHDPRGVSENEAKIRHELVEDLQKQVWSNITRDVPRVYRVFQGYDQSMKQIAQRRAQACVRNAFGQRNQKTMQRQSGKVNKEGAAKAKRIVKELAAFWRKNEKDEVIARKKAEREALERAKAEEEAREAKRQSRKLNFLLTQTELYSHFIGKKIKTKEAEAAEGMDVEDEEKRGMEEIAIGEDGEPLPDLDYDEDDEENLRRHAARGAHAAIQAARDKARAFDDSITGRGAPLSGDDTMDGDELNFQNPSLGENSVTITQPKMLMAQLKEYQLKGLTWLGNLYEQGINGILADEMGLGKTIQSISLLAYLAEHHNLWGPFLVIAPASTLHNWQQELARFVPRLKALPYWGSPKDRETLRKIWSRKNQTFSEESPFHILVTSYQLAVQDEKYFQELWALLHFIMPQLFDSHEEFAEWFSKDIESSSGGVTGNLKPEQLKRLHMILKPFMLRRVKKHVQKELGDKIEIDLLVDLSQRQREIYKALRQRVSISDLLATADNNTDNGNPKNMRSLVNLVMQFRKVCNHPDLFERADVVSPFVFGEFSQSGNLAREGDGMYLPDSARNAIEVQIPRILWTDGGKLDVPGENSLAGSDTKVLQSLLNIWTPEWINERTKRADAEFGWVKLLGSSPGETSRRAKSPLLVQLLEGAEEERRWSEEGRFIDDSEFSASVRKGFRVASVIPNSTQPGQIPLREISRRVWDVSYLSRDDARCIGDYAIAPIVKPIASNRSFLNAQDRILNQPLAHSALYGLAPSELHDPSAAEQFSHIAPSVPLTGLIPSSASSQTPVSPLHIPPTKRLIVDSAKLARLDALLRELKAGGHRILLYFQMTKMMDLIEEYLIFRQYKYLRLDGSSPIAERRDMVTSWQTNPDIFVFCLSTRAGGLGINLTAADTVIFYDHDWNPSSDAQAMDRAHRVGQTKQVTVYRLVARGTIEERILQMARGKKDVQDVVVGTKSVSDVAKPSEIVSLFMDDEELAESVAKRKQAEAHGYIAPTVVSNGRRSQFGDGLVLDDGEGDDGFFNAAAAARANAEEEEGLGAEEESKGKGKAKAAVAVTFPGSGEKRSHKKGMGKKAQAAAAAAALEKVIAGSEESPAASKTPVKKKVKIALGPDGLPL
ncbi:DNA helicase INO80 [Cryptococcus deuterogattii 99/473]|uniref:Chromatin-remodeling ATPase INO80 n=1 Tax=Cryptococcus deuterogattii Ram5 TaxID=1296110 RepID=A0A0D0TYE2_9TREE|nr:DNA helicase INO80 [Cryptococcus deuterogattii Ram5]KIY55301.1 DNA helicase INO80 [Cryptococcus deuterogattii 99/473]